MASGKIKIALVFLMLLGAATVYFSSQDNEPYDLRTPLGKNNPFSKMYSAGKCRGEGVTTFSYSPMQISDIGRIEPYGLMLEGHVIPTSHGYISPAKFNSEPDAYPVFAPADGFIVSAAYRELAVGDYQIYFEHSCTFYSYYDLLTSLAPEIAAEIGELSGQKQKRVRIPVKAGQLVGRIGGRTVDFAVWNFAKQPAYFVNPKSYVGDEDRFYLDDMFDYFKEPLKSELLAKNMRTAEPRTGTVAYDLEGKLVGNWFREGSGGSVGLRYENRQPDDRYWDGHLSIVYDFLNPAQIKFSVGNFQGGAAQFRVVGNAPDPATVGMDSGLIKYELLSTVAPGTPDGLFRGTALLELVQPGRLKLELFPGLRANLVDNFTDKAVIYER